MDEWSKGTDFIRHNRFSDHNLIYVASRKKNNIVINISQFYFATVFCTERKTYIYEGYAHSRTEFEEVYNKLDLEII